MLLLATPHAAHAQAGEAPRSFALNWVREPGAEACMSSQMLARAIEQLLGPVFERPADAELAIEGRIGRDAAGAWTVSIRITDARGAVLGTRELSSTEPNCHVLDAQVVLVIGMAIDPEIALRGLPDELLAAFPAQNDAAAQLLADLRAEHDAAQASVAPAAQSAADDASAATANATSEPGPVAKPEPAEAPEPPGWRVEPYAGVAASVGLQPATSAGIALGVRVQAPSWWGIELSGVFWLPVDAALAASATREPGAVRFSALQTTLAFCPRMVETVYWLWSACAGGTLGSRSYDVGPLEQQAGPTRFYWAPTLGSELMFRPWRPVFVQAAFAAGIVLPRDHYQYEDTAGRARDLFVPSAAAAWGMLAAGAHF
jgi:hypothetical protein